jgi:hypothetical protein
MLAKWEMQIASLACVLLQALSAGPAAGQTQLTYRAKQGDVLQYEIVQRIAIKETKGKELGMNEDRLNVAWSVTAIDESGKATVKFRITRLQKLQEWEGKRVAWDTNDKKSIEALGKGDRPIPGLMDWFTVTFDKRGQMADLRMPPDFEREIQEGAKIWKGLLSEQEVIRDTVNNIKNSVNPIDLVFPVDSVSKSGTWKSEKSLPLVPVKQHNTFALAEPVLQNGKSLDKIMLKITSELDSKQSPFKIDVKGEGYILFDNVAGRLVEAHVVTEANDSANPSDPRVITTTTVKLR